MSFIAAILANLGGLFANIGSQMCGFWWYDEEETPKSLIK
ncbi:MAG: cyclic lactone autoinducer peptide [Bacilli bacterium]|nr:cyclic lactone autoinducer peptide [Bacilli bacterium]